MAYHGDKTDRSESRTDSTDSYYARFNPSNRTGDKAACGADQTRRTQSGTVSNFHANENPNSENSNPTGSPKTSAGRSHPDTLRSRPTHCAKTRCTHADRCRKTRGTSDHQARAVGSR